MTDLILTLNAGSSSIKFALFDRAGTLERPVLSGQADGLGRRGRLVLRDGAGRAHLDAALQSATHAEALRAALQALDAAAIGEVSAVGHRVVHGGTRFDGPRRVDPGTMAEMAALLPLAPLHQPHNLAGIRAAAATFPGVPQVACFDTAFHRTMPEVHQRFALAQVWHDKGIRRYGFHGLSYESIARQLRAQDGDGTGARVVVAHLGNGASMCALAGGRSVATTMSFSPLDGLPSGTRCGRIDAAAVLHLVASEGLGIDAVSQLLSRESGWLGLSGLTGDMRELLASEAPAARLAVDHFVEQVLRELAGLAASLRGLDAIVFTGGIGENAAGLRARVLREAAWLGVELDAEANDRAPGRISTARSPVQAWVLRTNEESVIARHTAAVVPAKA
jgi:acetate kinase